MQHRSLALRATLKTALFVLFSFNTSCGSSKRDFPTDGSTLHDGSQMLDGPATVDGNRLDAVAVSLGVPFGPYNLYGGGGAGPSSWDTPLSAGTSSFTLSSDFADATGIIRRIDSARQRNLKLLTHMTGGDHTNYITGGAFDIAKWRAKMDSYNTAQIRAAVATAVMDGIIIGNSVMDEPHHVSWGGVLTKQTIDQMCSYVKGIFPTLPVGVVHDHDIFEAAQSYAVCDFIVDQFAHRKSGGDITQFRDEALAMATRDHHSILFSLNILDGGIRDDDNDGIWECPTPLTQGQGTYSPNCRMTAAQVEQWGSVLGSAGCALTMWRYDATFMSRTDNQAAFATIAQLVATVPSKNCRRTD